MDKIKTTFNSTSLYYNNIKNNNQNLNNSISPIIKQPETIDLLSINKNLTSNYDTIAPEDSYLKEILKSNPNLVYQGTERVKQIGGYWKYSENESKRVSGNIEHSVEFNSYKIYDKISGCTFHIQRFYSSEETIKEIIDTVNSAAKINPDLMYNTKIVISDFPCSSSEYFQDYGRDGNVPCTGGLNEKGEKTINFYKEWIDQKQDYKDWKFIVMHEAGHCYDYVNNQISNNLNWKSAMNKDNNFVSQYAYDSYKNRIGDQKYVEDFAEAISYLYSYGPEYFEKNFPNRTKILKELFPKCFD